MTIDVLMSQLFNFSKPTYFRWKKEGRPIIKLLDKYFEKEDLIEFLDTGSISKFEFLPDITQIIDDTDKKLKEILIRFLGKEGYNHTDFLLNITNVFLGLEEEKEEISLSNLLIFLNTSDHDYLQNITPLQKIAYTAAVGSLSEFEFKVARRWGLL